MAGAPALTTYREGSLHAALKALYTRPGDLVEEAVDGHVVDVARDDEVVEIQTGSFASAARKLRHLVGSHRIALVYPIALERWLVRVDADGVVASRRRSPRRGTTLDLFEELVAFPELLAHPGFRLELVLIKEEEIRGPIPDGARYRHPRLWWRLDRRLLEVVDTVRVDTATDLLGLLPAGLPDPFTSADIAVAGRCSKRIGMRAAYCLRRSGAISIVGKSGRLQTYTAVAGERGAGHSRAAEAPGQ